MFAYSVALTVISCGGMGYALFGRDQPAPLMTTFFAFCYFWYGLSPIMSLEFGAFPGGSTYTDHDIVYAYQVVIIGIAYYVGGYALGRKHRSRNVGTVDRASPTDWDRRLQLIAAAAIGMSLSAWWSLGGFALTFSTRLEAEALLRNSDPTEGLAVSGLITAVMRVPPALLLVAATATRKRASGRGRHLVMLVALALTNLLVSSPFSTPRQWVGAVAVATALALFPSRKGTRLSLVLAIASISLIYPALDGLRRGSTLSFGETSITESLGSDLDFDVMSTTIDATTAAHSAGYQRGTQALGLIAFAIPRSAWVGKPAPSGTFVFENSPTNNSPTSNMSVSLWAEGYIDFGLIGVAIYLSALGFISARLDKSREDPRGLTISLVLVPLLAGMQFIFLRGALLPVISVGAALLTTYFVVLWAIGPVLPSRRVIDTSRGRGRHVVDADTFGGRIRADSRELDNDQLTPFGSPVTMSRA